MSPETDIILYARQIMPPALYDGNKGYVAAEAALYTIEVKPRLTTANLRQSIANARRTQALPLVETIHFIPEGGRQTVNGAERKVLREIHQCRTKLPAAINILFAVGSDLKGDPVEEIRRYRKLDAPTGKVGRAMQALCIVGRGYWFTTKEEEDGWGHAPATADHAEVMGFLIGLTNTLPALLAHKGRPQFGNYLGRGIHGDLPTEPG